MENKKYWFVGSTVDGQDETKRFIEQGIWEFNAEDKHNYLSEMQVGDAIAMKSSYVKKHNLPFDANGQNVSVMAIKARGVITDKIVGTNTLKVEWEKLEPVKEWYFYTARKTIWKVNPDGRWLSRALIDFTFNDKPQEYQRFLAQPFWAERFNSQLSHPNYQWTAFYTEFAHKLLDYAKDRTPLIQKIHEIAAATGLFSVLNDQDSKGNIFPLTDICPFTVFALFNRGITDENRTKIAAEFADFLKVGEPTPTKFGGIPTANNQKTWFFGYQKRRKATDIDDLWHVFSLALRYAKNDELDDLEQLKAALDKVQKNYGAKWNITYALYWILPWQYLPLDARSRSYLEQALKLSIPYSSGKKPPTAEDYFDFIDQMHSYFMEDDVQIHSFPELSWQSWIYNSNADSEVLAVEETGEKRAVVQVFNMKEPINKILYGPPGTGKTHSLTEIQNLYTVSEASVSEEQWLKEQLKNSTMFDVVFMVVHLLGGKDVKVADIHEHPYFQAKLHSSNSLANAKQRIWGNLQTHASDDSTTVKYARRVPPFVFDKTESSTWFLTGDWQEEMADQIDLANQLQQGRPAQLQQQNYKMVTFHQSYGYEDFIEGLKPITNSDTNEVSYEVVPGVFKQICLDAKSNPNNRYAIFIDEINRGNISKIFGELITLIEPDKRTNYDHAGKLVAGIEVELPYSKEKFGVPANLDIYGTMNTADRSIALLDTALRRRFAFEELMPQPELLKGADGLGNIHCEEGSIHLPTLLDTLNQRIEFLLHRDLTLGHAYLMKVKTLDALVDVLKNQFIPLLQEYFYNDWRQLQLVFNDLNEYGNKNEPQIIQHQVVSANGLFKAALDMNLDEKIRYQVNSNIDFAAIYKIYADE